MNYTAIGYFLVVIAITLSITVWAARRTHSKSAFYTAGESITGTQNGFAIAGDFMSAATILGVGGLVFTGNAESITYTISPVVGLAFVLFFIAEPLRNLGRYTVAEVISLRFPGRSVRGLTAVGALSVSIFYLIAQMVGAGSLIQVLTGIPYRYAVVAVAALMMLYVTFGGMLATTWVQIVKAVILSLGAFVMTYLVLAKVGFAPGQLYELAGAQMQQHLNGRIGGPTLASFFSSASLALALTCGMAGMPHVLIRFFTVPNASEARRSVITAVSIIVVVFCAAFFVLAYGAAAFVYPDAASFGPDGKLIGGNNMPVIHLARVLGGDVLLGIMAAVAFATILAVVAGLTIAGAGSLAHDLYAQVLRGGKVTDREELTVVRVATVLLTVVAVLLALLFQRQNIAFMVSLAFAVAASANFPVLMLALYWRGLTKAGALAGAGVGLLVSIGLILAGPAIWVDFLGKPSPLFGSGYPALVSMPLAFLFAIVVSKLDARSSDAAASAEFDRLRFKALTGRDP